MFTREHYEFTALFFKHQLPEGNAGLAESERAWWSEMVTEMAKEFKADNPAFDYKRFFEACGIDEDNMDNAMSILAELQEGLEIAYEHSGGNWPRETTLGGYGDGMRDSSIAHPTV